MSKRLSRKAKEHLRKARESCLTAVASYNDPLTTFRSGSYIVLMVIAWTSLFHAVFYKQGERPWIVRSGTGRGRRYERVDGEPRHWGLQECRRNYFKGTNSAVQKNLEFMQELRDRIEHRDMPELDDEIFGECQAALLNFEQMLADEFGSDHALNTSLTFSLQFSGLVPREREVATQRLRRAATPSIVAYVRRFRSELTVDVAADQRFAFRVFLVPQLANHRSTDTLAVEFIHFDPGDPAAMKAYEEAVVLLKPRQSEVRNAATYLPKEVTAALSERLPWDFKVTPHHADCWKHFQVRPVHGAADPAACDTKYCQWDRTFRRHVYTDAWIEKLGTELQTFERFKEVTGREPVARTPQS